MTKGQCFVRASDLGRWEGTFQPSKDGETRRGSDRGRLVEAVNRDASPRLSRRRFIGSAAGFSAGAVVSGLGWRAEHPTEVSAQTVSAPSRGGSIQLALGQPAQNIDPARFKVAGELLLSGAIYETLVDRDEKYGLTPVLAESWKSNPAGTEWTFRLRSGVRFQDGTPLTARDVAYSLARPLDKALGSIIYGRLSLGMTKEGILATDERTLVIRTSRPDVFLPLSLATNWTPIFKEGTTEFSVQTSIGTGPFQLTSFTPGQSWEVKRNPYYWRKGLPNLDGIRAVSIPEQVTKIQSLISGDTDVTDYIDTTAAATLSAGNVYVIQEKEATDIRIVMRESAAPFNDPRVTMAFKLASDRELLLRIVYRGLGTVTSDVPVPRDDPFYPPQLPIRKQDIDKARSLLREAGYPNGLDQDLYVTDFFGGMSDVAVTYAQSVRPAGIRLNVKKVPTDVFMNSHWLKAPLYVSYLARRHPSDVLPLTFTSAAKWPEGQFNSKKLDGLVEEAGGTIDTAKQRRLYQEAMLIIANEAPIHIPLFVNKPFGVKKRLQGVKTSPTKHLNFVEAFIKNV